MRNKFVSLKVLALLVIFCLTGSLTRAAVNPKPFVVPELKQWTGKDGNFTPGKDARIVCTSQNPELLRIARMHKAKPRPAISSYPCRQTRSSVRKVTPSR